MPGPVAGRVALVTGGTGGIGRSIVTRLIAQQVKVHILDLVPPADWNSSQSSPSFHVVDVTDERSVDTTIDAIEQGDGRIDYLIYCAGIFRPNGLMQMSIDDLRRTISINLTGSFLCCRAVLHAMRARGFGRIVLISSMLARTGAANEADYAASKGGILGLARSLALEVAGNGIQVDTISPGVVDTAMPRAIRRTKCSPLSAERYRLDELRASRMAEACLFLLGDDSSYLTGQDLRVNGGATIW